MSERRQPFCLDATTMGLSDSKHCGESTTDRSEECHCNDEQQRQRQKHQEAINCCEQQLQQELKKIHMADKCNKLNRCNTEPVPTNHYRKQLTKLRGISGDASLINFELNDIFLKRLEDIDALGHECGDSGSQLRLVTFQDWVDLLLHVNFIIFNNMSNLETESYAKIMSCFQSVRGEQQQVLDENRKLRKDICAIIKLVQAAYHHNNWCTDDMRLESLSVTQLLGIQEGEGRRPESETEKVNKCMKSLASEVAAKHDEVCQLQSQLVALDEVVQTARQKLILKDKCIAQLNQQLSELQDCFTRMSRESVAKGSKTSADCSKSSELEDICNSLETPSCLFDGLNEKDQQASELLRMLNTELTEFIDLLSKKDFSAMETRRKLLSCFFERINSDRAETQRQLEALRNSLRDLNCNLDELTESPIGSSTKIEDEGDALIVEALRRRMQNLNESNKELNVRCQRLDAQYKVQLLEAQFTYQAEHVINEKNCQALKEIADLLSKLRCTDLSYEEIYEDSPTENPFCAAIMEIYNKLTELENSKECEELISTPSNSDNTKTPAEPIAKTTTTTTPTTTTTSTNN